MIYLHLTLPEFIARLKYMLDKKEPVPSIVIVEMLFRLEVACNAMQAAKDYLESIKDLVHGSNS